MFMGVACPWKYRGSVKSTKSDWFDDLQFYLGSYSGPTDNRSRGLFHFSRCRGSRPGERRKDEISISKAKKGYLVRPQREWHGPCRLCKMHQHGQGWSSILLHCRAKRGAWNASVPAAFRVWYGVTLHGIPTLGQVRWAAGADMPTMQWGGSFQWKRRARVSCDKLVKRECTAYIIPWFPASDKTTPKKNGVYARLPVIVWYLVLN